MSEPREWTLQDILFTKINLRDVDALARACGKVLANHHPAIQGAALAETLGKWLAGHPAQLREQLLLGHIKQVRELLKAE